MKTIITLFLAIGSMLPLTAQEHPGSQAPRPPRPPQEGPGRKQQKEMLLDRLQLTTAQREQLKKEQEQALEKVLTTEQKKKLSQLRQQQQQRKEEGLRRQRQQLKDRLSITEEQASKLQALQKNFMESMKKNREQLDQTVAQQRERARSLMEAHQESLKKMLNMEQLQQFKDIMRDKMREGMEKWREHRDGMRRRPPAPSNAPPGRNNDAL